MELKLGPLLRNKFLGAPYKLGGQSKREGFDCFSFIYCFYKELGFDMPDGIDGVSATDYMDLWERDEEAAKKVMWNYINTFTDLISISNMAFGDIVVIKLENGNLYPSIYGGNDKIVLSEMDRGIVVYSLDMFEFVGVRRWSSNG